MNTKDINRKSFLHNFLKKIIVRLDYQRVLEKDMESFLSKAKSLLNEFGFDRYAEKNANEVNLEINNSGIGDPVTPKTVKTQKIYSFMDETKGYTIDISDTFIVLTISSAKYTPFEEYMKMFLEVVGLCKTEFSFFSVKRFGIRKTNICLVTDQLLINTYFSKDQLRLYDNLSDVESFANSTTDNFKISNYLVNYKRSIRKGVAKESVLFEVVIDIDIYSNDVQQINNLLSDNEQLGQCNNILFDIFKNSLTPDLIDALSKEEFSIAELIGVEQNE